MSNELLTAVGAISSLLTCLLTFFTLLVTYKNYSILSKGWIDLLFVKNTSKVYLHIYNRSKLPVNIIYLDDILLNKIFKRELSKEIYLNQLVPANSSEPICMELPDDILKKPNFMKGEYRPPLKIIYSFDNIKKLKTIINKL